MSGNQRSSRRWHFTIGVLEQIDLSQDLRAILEDLSGGDDGTEGEFPVAVAMASEILSDTKDVLPDWVLNTEARYLVLRDVATPALMRLPSILGLHRPDVRLHVTDDRRTVHRLLVAQMRRHPFEGFVDAYPLADALVTLLGDMSIRSFPVRDVSSVEGMTEEEWSTFEIDPDGSFLHWPERDLHLAPSQLLQAVDPAYLAEVEIDRYESDRTGSAIARLREREGLRQVDVPDLSARRVRRIEQGVSRLTVDAARKFAKAFGQSLRDFLDAIAREAGEIRTAEEDDDPIPSDDRSMTRNSRVVA